jgi:hypothetical protein
MSNDEHDDQTATRLWTGGHPPTGGFVCHPNGEVEDYEDWCHTEFGPQISAQAWSEGEHAPAAKPYKERHRWTTIAAGAAALVATGTLIASTILLSAKTDDHNEWPPGSGVPPTPAAQTPMSPEVPEPPMPPWTPRNVPDAQEITHDGAFLQTFHQAGFNITDPPTVVTNAHIICQNLAIASRSTVVLFMYRSDPVYAGWTIPQVATLVDLATQFYCPGRG